MTEDQLQAIIDYIDIRAHYEAQRVTVGSASYKTVQEAEHFLRMLFGSERATKTEGG